MIDIISSQQKSSSDDFCCDRTCRGDTKQVMKSLSVEDGEGQTAESGQGEALRGVELMK